MIDSLLAIKIFLVNRIAKIVGIKPANPGIAEMTMSVLLESFILSKLFKIIIFFFLNFIFTFL